MEKRTSIVSKISEIPNVFSRQSRLSRVSLLNIESPPSWLGVRHMIVFMLFLCLVFAYIIRVNVSVAIVAMIGNGTIVNGEQTYEWSTQTKSVILSSFFWGYLVMNLPAAVIGHSFNNKRLLGATFALASILSILTPAIVSWGGSTALIILRICQGLFQGFMMPMVHGLLSKWAPPQERGRFNTYILGGIQFGTLIVLAIGGVVCDRLGWPMVFYLSGIVGLCWVVVWMIVGGNSPEVHRFIPIKERLFIQRSLPNTAGDNEKIPIPWRAIWTSGPQYAVTLAHIGQNWGLWTLLTETPTYFNKALNFDLSDGGFIEAAPYLLEWIVSFPLSFFADFLIIKGYTTVGASRKIWNTVAHFGGAAALLGIAFYSGDTAVCVMLYTIAIVLNCCVYMGFNVNHLDLSPNFARILMGISNGSSNISAIIAPLFVGAVVKDEYDVYQWRIVWICAAVSYSVANLCFFFLGSGELQPWNEPDYLSKKHDTEKSEEETGPE